MIFKLTFILIILAHYVHSNPSKPSLEIYPKHQQITLPEGENGIFTCSGRGHDPAFFTNLKWIDPKGREINEENEFYSLNYIIRNQAGSVTLKFLKPTDNLSGNYTCKGAFQHVVDLSESIQITFFQDITWQDCPTTQALIKGQKGPLIRCKVSAKPPAELTWSMDGKEVKSKRLIPTNDGLLVEGEVDDSLGGQYDIEAHVMETGKIKYTSIIVKVYTSPEIVELKPQYEVVEDEEAKLECKAIGVPPPRHYWLDAQKRNLSSVGGYLVDTDNGQLIINKVNKEQVNGEFTCQVENAAGVVYKKTQVSVLSRPRIIEFRNKTSVQGTGAQLSCVAFGNPPPEIQIRKDGESNAITSGGNYNVESTRFNDFENRLTMNIYSVQRQDDGLYYCVAKNKIGEQDQIGHLQVEYKPDLSKTLRKVKTWQDVNVNLTCIVSSIPNATVSWYFKNQMISPSNEYYQMINEDQTMGHYKNVYTGVNYLLVRPHSSTRNIYGDYTCRAENAHGYDTAVIELSQAFRPSLNGDLELFDDSPTSVKIRIPSHIISDGGLTIKNIHIKYRERNETESMARTETFPFDNELILKNLRPRRTYYISASAQNDVGSSDWTPDREKMTPRESVPDCPRFTYSRQSAPTSAINRECGEKPKQPIDADQSDKFDIKWLQPNDGGRPIEYYALKVYPVVRTLDSWNRIGDYKEMFSASKDQLVHHLANLRPNVTYAVELRAKNEEGYSASSYLIFRTSVSNDPSSFQEQITKAFTNFQLMIIIVLITIAIVLLVLDIILYVRYDFGLIFCICHGCSSSDRHRAVKKMKNSHSLNTALYHRSSAEIDPIMGTNQNAEFKAELENRLIRLPKHSAV